ncbi:MAG TPA: RNA polymerase sigma factor [Ktedonobacteraceae bacterium]|nr:RNA polymerase sigma factor [Ktedonobacteraceae bacterium]
MDEAREAKATQREPAAEDSPLAALFQAHAPGLLNYVREHTGSREDAEDIVLGAFTAALESNILLTRSEKEQAAWLWRVAKNKLADYRRRAMRHASATLQAVEETIYVDDAWQPDELAMRGEAYAELREAVASLPALQQEIVRLRFGQGLRCKEIALRLNKGEGAVRMLLSRSLNSLRRNYDRQAEGEIPDE